MLGGNGPFHPPIGSAAVFFYFKWKRKRWMPRVALCFDGPDLRRRPGTVTCKAAATYILGCVVGTSMESFQRDISSSGPRQMLMAYVHIMQFAALR
jgi:hypothetical protein